VAGGKVGDHLREERVTKGFTLHCSMQTAVWSPPLLTVAKFMAGMCPDWMRSRSTPMGTCCISGCTDTCGGNQHDAPCMCYTDKPLAYN
jgi:hypothetical protein